MKTLTHFQRIVLLAICLCFAGIAQAQNDGFSESPVAYNLRDISVSGTNLPFTDDQILGPFSIGFTFNFYGIDYTDVYISSNGFMTFSAGQSNGCCSGDPIPDSASPDNFVAGFWEDLDPPEGAGNVRYETLGAAPNREFVVGFYDVEHFPSGTAVTFEMILHEGSNNVEFQYLDASSDSSNHSVGAEDQDGQFGYQVAFGNLTFETVGILLSPEPIIIRQVPTIGGLAAIIMALLLGLLGVAHFRRTQGTA